MKLDKKDKKILIGGFIVGTILNFFINKSIDIVFMLGILYFVHKYFDANKYTENMEFINKEKYIEGLNRIIKVLNIYIIIKIILILVTQIGGFNGMEIILLAQIALIYSEILARKYVKSVNNVEVERNRKLLNNKILTVVVLIGFVGFTCNYFNKLEFEDNYINSPKYKYELTYDKENNRIADFSGNGFSMVATENKDNEKNFNKYIKEIKLLSAVDVLQDSAKNEKYTTNISGTYNEYGLEDMFGDNYIAERKDIRKALKEQGLSDEEIENVEWYAWMGDEEMITHDSSYREELESSTRIKGIGILAFLIVIYLLILIM